MKILILFIFLTLRLLADNDMMLMVATNTLVEEPQKPLKRVVTDKDMYCYKYNLDKDVIYKVGKGTDITDLNYQCFETQTKAIEKFKENKKNWNDFWRFVILVVIVLIIYEMKKAFFRR